MLGVNVCGLKIAGEAVHEAAGLAGDQVLRLGAVSLCVEPLADLQCCGQQVNPGHEGRQVRGPGEAKEQRPSLPMRGEAAFVASPGSPDNPRCGEGGQDVADVPFGESCFVGDLSSVEWPV